MAEESTPRFGLPFPGENGKVGLGRQDIKELAEAVDAILASPGDLRLTAKGTLDAGWLTCEGQAVSRTTYAALFAAIGTAYGIGNGTSTFNVPDYRGRTPIGTGQGMGLTSRARGAAVGEETHKLSATESGVAEHSHNFAEGGVEKTWTQTFVNLQLGGTSLSMINGPSNSTTAGVQGGAAAAGAAHNNMQPSLACNVWIRT